MKCDMCGKNDAVFHSKSNINGNISEVYLCEDCYNKSNFSKQYKNEFINFFDDSFFNNNSLLGNFFSDDQLINNKMYDTRCPNCGCSFEDFSTRGLLGCSKCYDYFSNKLKPVIENMQFSSNHVGKTLNQNFNKQENEIAGLRRKLKIAVDEENYELASEIKKQIVALEGKNEK